MNKSEEESGVDDLSDDGDLNPDEVRYLRSRKRKFGRISDVLHSNADETLFGKSLLGCLSIFVLGPILLLMAFIGFMMMIGP